MVRPFLERHPQRGLPLHTAKTRSVYQWATAVVSAYSFTIGTEKFQAMVPMWDALNHITGRANVRLHHCARTGALQMIATRRIQAGEQVCIGDFRSSGRRLCTIVMVRVCHTQQSAQHAALAAGGSRTPSAVPCAQLVNCFGKLSNGELLRRYGFVEAEPNPHDCAEIALSDVLRACHRSQGGCAGAPPAAGNASGDGPLQCGCTAPEIRLRFMAAHGLLPATGWFKVNQAGVPCGALLEAARLLLLTDARFAAFERRVHTWRVPKAPLLSDARDEAAVPEGLRELLLRLCDDRLAAFWDPGEPCAERGDTRVEVRLHDDTCRRAAAVVREGEMRCLRRFRSWLATRDEHDLIRRCAKAWRSRHLPVCCCKQ